MLVELICPKCGGKMEVDSSREKCFCTFCGAEVVNMAQKIDINQVKAHQDKKNAILFAYTKNSSYLCTRK